MKTEYEQVDQAPSDECLLPESERPRRERSGFSRAQLLKKHLPFLISHLCLALLWMSVTFTQSWTLSRGKWVSNDKAHLRQRELPFAAPAIEYETVEMHFQFGDSENSFVGKPTFEKELRWWNLVNVGMYSLSPEEEQQLKSPTSPPMGTDTKPLIQIDMFHQLHCVNTLRKMVYGVHELGKGAFAFQHADHCIDFLRQVIMCNGDTTPITHFPGDPRSPFFSIFPYDVNWSSPRTCRKFNPIYDFAAKGNTSGHIIEIYPGVKLPHLPGGEDGYDPLFEE